MPEVKMGPATCRHCLGKGVARPYTVKLPLDTGAMDEMAAHLGSHQPPIPLLVTVGRDGVTFGVDPDGGR